MQQTKELTPELKAAYRKLVEAVNFHDFRYWVKNAPLISDEVYDEYVRQLEQMERAYPAIIEPDSPTQRLPDAKLPGFVSAKHIQPMLSLAKLFTADELKQKLESMQAECSALLNWTVEAKIDGLSVDLKYVDGVLVQAIRRGRSSDEGDDVTANVKAIRSIPLNLDVRQVAALEIPEVIHVRGEIFMTMSDLKTINAEREKNGEPRLANCRNAAAGAMASLDPREVAKRRLQFIPYTVIAPLPEDQRLIPATQFSRNRWFDLLGFQTLSLEAIQLTTTIDEAIEAVTKFGFTRKLLPFPTDGCVIKIDQSEFRNRFAGTSTTPGWAFAFKYEPERAETKLLGITVQVGRSGVMAPVAELMPVELDGSVISRASLHNEARIQELDVRIGDTVIIRKAGEIIPEIVGVALHDRDPKSVPYVFPSCCPSCGQQTVRRQTTDGESAVRICEAHDDCPDQIEGRIEHWCKAVGIESMGPVTAHKLVKAGLLRKPADLYSMQLNPVVELIGEANAQTLLAEIDKSAGAGMERVLVGLGIHRIGETLSKRMAMRFVSVWEMLDLSDEEFLKRVPNFGNVNFAAYKAWKSEGGAETLRQLEKNGVCVQSTTYNPDAANGPLSGKTFVFTGEISMDRSQAERLVEERGGRATSSVSKKTTYLVMGADAGATKIKKARELGITVLDEQQFLKMLE